MLYRQLVLFIALGLSLPAHAATRTWEFDLKTPGTYELHVQHNYDAAPVPRGAEVSYSIQTAEKTTTRAVPFYRSGDGHPYVELIVDVLSPQKVDVVITGIPRPFLKQAKVYLIDINTRYPYEWFDPGKNVDLESAKHLRAILQQPEHEIDLAKVKLTIDRMIDPTLDIEAGLKKIDTIVAQIRAMPDFGVSQTAKLQALKRYIYEPGEWNDFRPFRYDLDDPLGTTISHKLLPHYLKTREGNCVTMPLLFVILGQRLGIDITVATAPVHILAKFRDENVAWHNLETTSGAEPTSEAWIRQQLPMTDKAISNGVYLRPLTKKETAALMGETLTELYVDLLEFEKVITLSDLILEYYPKNVTVMIRKSNAYYDLMEKYYLRRYRSPADIPDRAKGHYHYLAQNNRFWANKAQALGWQEWRQEDDEKYLRSIKEAKAKYQN